MVTIEYTWLNLLFGYFIALTPLNDLSKCMTYTKFNIKVLQYNGKHIEMPT